MNEPRGDLFSGRLLVVAPHMDDEVLACGGLIASRAEPRQVFVIYATDGTRSPAPVLPGRDASSPEDLGRLRCEESIAAMAVLGVPAHNLAFLGLPEAELSDHETALASRLAQHVTALQPDCILVPFRFDKHPDHLAVNRAVTGLVRAGRSGARLFEYFVYYRSRLLPRGDIRNYLHPADLVTVDIASVAARKRAALDCFRTQTTRFYPWQTRPILQPALLDEECSAPERFLRYDPSRPDTRVFTGWVAWIRIAHRWEPLLVRWKYVLKSLALRAVGRG